MSEKGQSSPGLSSSKELRTEVGSGNVQKVWGKRSDEVFQAQVDTEPSQSENPIVKAKQSIEGERDQANADDLVPWNLLQDQVISAPKKTTSVGFKRDQALAAELKSEEDSVQDQSIIAPEIMSLILEQLDLRSLKQVRLACKSWLLQAQYHLLKRGIVHLRNDTVQSLCYSGISKFAAVCQKRIRALPLPFQFVDLYLQEASVPSPPLVLTYFFSLSQPLAVSRFSQGPLSVHLALPFIIQCSSTLEYLRLSAASFNARRVSPAKMDVLQQLNFPKLRHLNVDANVDGYTDWWAQVPSVAACISKNSPILETYESNCPISYPVKELLSQLSLQVDIKNVKNLYLPRYELNTVAFNHFLTIPFAQLQCLKMSVKSEGSETNTEALTSTVTKCANSLTTLDLSFNAENIADLNLPVCPNVRELTLRYLMDSDGGILSYIFPALQVVNVNEIKFDVDKSDDWDSPLFELQTLRIQSLYQFNHCYRRREYGSSCGTDIGGYGDNRSPRENEFVWREIKSDSSSSKQLITFFEKFPGLERLCIPSSNIIGLCQDIWDKKCCSNLLEGVKNLELCGKHYDYSPLAVLKGIETITMMEFNDSVPVADLPGLKLLQFPWGAFSKMNTPKVMEVASRVRRVAITNCCSFPRTGDAQSKKLLETFFELASNAECGCKDGNKSPKMMLYL